MKMKIVFLIAALFSSSDSFNGDRNKAGLILLHGLGIDMGPQELCSAFTKFGLGLSQDTIVRCPSAKRRPVGVIPPTFIPGLNFARSWFNFWLMPGISVFSSRPGEDRDELMEALGEVEEVIEDLMSEGVPSENIVVSGLSQGGALTLWTAMHTRYRLGGFVPIVTWLPLAKVEPPRNLPFQPVNINTPIFHMNGMADPIVPVWPAGRVTERLMKEVFSDYTFKAIPFTTHATTAPSPVTMPILKKWLKENTNLKFKGGFSGISDMFGGGGGFSNLFGGWGR